MPRLGMCSNNLNYLQNKTSRLYHIRRTYKNVKCKNKNVLGVLKSSKYISLFEPRQSVKFSCKMPLNESACSPVSCKPTWCILFHVVTCGNNSIRLSTH